MISWISLYLEALKYAMNHPASSMSSLGWAFVISIVEIYSPLYIKSVALPPLDEAISVIYQVYIKLYKSVYKTFAIKLILKKI